MSVDEDNAE